MTHNPLQPGAPSVPDLLDTRLTQALETPPNILIPQDFAQRLALQAAADPALTRNSPAQTSLSRPLPSTAMPHFGRLAIRAALAVLLLAMFTLAPHAFAHSTSALTVEFSFAAEFLALTVFLSLRPTLLR